MSGRGRRPAPSSISKGDQDEQVLRTQASGGTARAGDRARCSAGLERDRLGRQAAGESRGRRNVRCPGAGERGPESGAPHPLGEDGSRSGDRAGGPPPGRGQGRAPQGGRPRAAAGTGEDPALRHRPQRPGLRRRRQLVRPRGGRPALGGRRRLDRRSRPASPFHQRPPAGRRRAGRLRAGRRRSGRGQERQPAVRSRAQGRVPQRDGSEQRLLDRLVLRREGAHRVLGSRRRSRHAAVRGGQPAALLPGSGGQGRPRAWWKAAGSAARTT